MRKIKLTQEERRVEEALVRGEYQNAPKLELDEIARAVTLRRKDAVLNVRVNSEDLRLLKEKASKLGVRYQTFLTEILHRVAHS